MRIVSWNVNGIRSVLKKGFLESIANINPDILCLQEVRALPDQVSLDMSGYEAYWNPAQRKGYSGTAVFTKIHPAGIVRGMGVDELDDEGRVISLEMPDYFIVNCYTPNSGTELARLSYRTEKWDPAFLEHCKQLARSKPVILCGDLNVAHEDIDIYDPRGNEGSAGFTKDERHNFQLLIEAGFIDTFRQFNTDRGNYTWWSYIRRARASNHGWRIDYFCVSTPLKNRLKSASILTNVMGSDHCPIAIEMA